MDKTIGFFSDDGLTFVIYTIALILTGLAYLPGYLTDRDITRYNKTQKENLKQKAKPFQQKPHPTIGKVFFFIVLIGVFLGFAKYKKDQKNSDAATTRVQEVIKERDSLNQEYIKILNGIQASLNKKGLSINNNLGIVPINQNTTNNNFPPAIKIEATNGGRNNIKIGSLIIGGKAYNPQ